MTKTWEQARDEAAEQESFEFHGCFTGDCPHNTAKECGKHFFKTGADFGRAYGLAEERKRSEKLVEALERIDRECASHDTTAFTIAYNALEDFNAAKEGGA